MLDVGWPELLVIAIVLIVVVGPKDLPPMLRAFGKMTGRLRTMAGEFRQQFDEALKEADLDDVRKTISDAQRLNPVNSLKDAMNPLRQMGADIRNDLQKAVKSEPAKQPEISVPEPFMKLPDEPPVVATVEEKPAESVAVTPAKPVRKPRAAKPLKSEAASAPAEEPKAAKAPVAAKKISASKKTAAAAKPVAVAEKPAVAKKPAAAKKTVVQSGDAVAGKTTGKSKKTSDA